MYFPTFRHSSFLSTDQRLSQCTGCTVVVIGSSLSKITGTLTELRRLRAAGSACAFSGHGKLSGHRDLSVRYLELNGSQAEQGE